MVMTFEELGDILRTERERQGLEIEDIADRLKISARILRALEDADQQALPHSVYVRGFVVAYARFLNLDYKEFLNVAELYDPSEDPSKNDPHFIAPRRGINKSVVFFILFLCLCIGAGAFAWLNRDADLFSQLKTTHLTTAQPAPSAVPAPAVDETPTEAKQEENVVNSEDEINKKELEEKEKAAKEEARKAAELAAKEKAQQAQALQANASSQNIETTNSAEQQIVKHEGPHRVIITAVAECWVHSNADQTDTRQFSLRAGDTFALTFSDTLSLKLGNAGGVRIRYNGVEMPVPGKNGEVKTITFPPA